MVIGPSGQPAWKDAVKNRLLTRTEPKAVRCVKDLIDHIIIESVKLYESTDMEDKFTMFHDALSAWNEGAVQEYIKEKYPGFEHRFITPVGKTCEGTIYKSKPPGNTPENARGLDAYGFYDLESTMSFNCALSWVYPHGDSRRIFGQGTPKEVWYLMEQT